MHRSLKIPVDKYYVEPVNLTSPVNSHLFTKERSCECKWPYKTKQEAEEAVRVVSDAHWKSGTIVHWYKCDYCHKYHVGHKVLDN